MEILTWIKYLATQLAPWASAAVSAVAVLLSFLFYWRNRTLTQALSDRSVRMEAQKLLLEFNKQLIADPNMWWIFDNEQDSAEKVTERSCQLKLRALGNLVLNMFDLTLSEIPKGPERTAWLNYFKDSVTRSTILRQILEEHQGRAVY